MKAGADVCVVGGGIIGVATAYFAAKAGLSVILLESDTLGSRATGHSFGGVSASVYRYAETEVPRHYVRLSLAGVRLYETLAGELGPPFDFTSRGELDPFEDEAGRDLVMARVEALRTEGVEVDFLEGDEARQLEPALSQAVRYATYCPTDGFTSPQRTTWAFAKKALQLGADIRTQTKATGIVVTGGDVAGVNTTTDSISADWVVIASGLGMPPLLETIGMRLPLAFSRGQMFVSERVPPMLNSYIHPIKQTSSGTILIGATVEPRIASSSTTLAGTREMLSRAVRLVPKLQEMRLLRSWAGIRPVPLDGYPIIGQTPALGGLILAVMHRGITLAPVVAEVITDIIIEGSSKHDISAYAPSRFKGMGQLDSAPRVEDRPDYVY